MEPISEIIRHWRFEVILMIIGAVLGFGISLAVPKEYKATVYLSATIDYNKVGKLDQLEEDRILGIPEDIINSDPVLEMVCEGDESCSPAWLRDHMLISRTLDTWSLSIIEKDAKHAAGTAVKWLDHAHQALMDALEHAFKAEAYQKELDGTAECIRNGASSAASVACSGIEESRSEIDRLSGLIRDELEASHGLSSAIRIGTCSPEKLTLRTASRSSAEGAVWGMLTGLLLSIGIIWFKARKASETQAG